MSFGTVILSDRHTIALENRAYREGAIGDSHHHFSKFVRNKVVPQTVVEDGVLDLMCLYEQLLVSEKRFDLHPLNTLSDRAFIRQTPNQIRELALSLSSFGKARTKSRLSMEPTMSAEQFELFTDSAFWDAQMMITKGVEDTLEDARGLYESEELLNDILCEVPHDVSHGSILRYIKSNSYWMVELFDEWFKTGGYNHLIDDYVLKEAGLPKEIRREFAALSRSRRFEYYFRHLQEAYAHTYESSFIAQVYDVENAFAQAPDTQRNSVETVSALDVCHLIRINLGDIVQYFPFPRSFEEAVEMRGSQPMLSFKAVLSEWVDSARSGHDLGARIRRDLRLANRDITRLRRYRDLKERPIYFGIRIALNNIPVVSNIMSAFDIAEYIYERRTKRRTSWVVTPSH